MDKTINDKIADILFYHNAYLPDSDEAKEEYNKITIENIKELFFPQIRKAKENERLRYRFIEMRGEGKTLAEIGIEYGCSRQRIHQIIKGYKLKLPYAKR